MPRKSTRPAAASQETLTTYALGRREPEHVATERLRTPTAGEREHWAGVERRMLARLVVDESELEFDDEGAVAAMSVDAHAHAVSLAVEALVAECRSQVLEARTSELSAVQRAGEQAARAERFADLLTACRAVTAAVVAGEVDEDTIGIATELDKRIAAEQPGG